MRLSPLLVVRAQTGDLTALNEVILKLQEPLYRHIVGIMGTENGADDVLQAVLLIVARKLGDVRDPRWATAWAYRVANREAVRATRQTRRYTSWDEVDDVEMPDTGADSLFDAEVIAQLRADIDTLTPAVSAVIRMHYLEELTLREIAEALELPLGTVKSRLAYGLAALRQQLRAP